MVRSMSRGQFHVTSAWDGYAALGGSETEEVIVPSEAEEVPDLLEMLEEGGPEPDAVEELPDPLLDVVLTAPRAPAPGPRGGEPSSDPHGFPAPDVSGTPAPIELSRPVPDPEPIPAASPRTATPVGGTEGSRTLVGLLARMWLLRSTVGANGATALPGPGLVAVDSTAAPVPSAPAPPARPVPPPPTPTVHEPPAVVPPVERSTLLPPDVDDGRPLGGLATFLIEFAGIANPAPSAPPALPVNGGVRARVVVRLLHCNSHLSERLVSRDSCRQPRVGR